jgi:hypothetical protein
MVVSENKLKRGLTGLVTFQAWESIKNAKQWADEKNYNWEVSDCVIAQLLIGILTESAINEVGEGLFPHSVWEGIEKTDNKTKWWIVSGQRGRTPFDYGKEPMQTVREVMTLRNKLAHPKVYEFPPEMMLQRMDGTVERGVDPSRLLQPGESPIAVAIRLHEDEGFNFITTLELFKKVVNALIALKEHMGSELLAWSYGLRNGIQHFENVENLK